MGAGVAMRDMQLKRERAQLKRERDHNAEVISELLSPGLKQKILSKRLRLADLQVTGPGACLNTDIVGYTKYAEGKDPDEVRRTINEYFDVLDTVLEQHGVDSSDFTGDGMMGVWSDKTPDASLRRRVCDAALEVASAAERFRLARCDAPFATRVGVHYGHLQIGMIGGSSHKEYRPIGDVPNTASRLQALNETLGTRVLVSEEVIKGLLDRFVVRDLGHFVLRGKKNPTHVYELIGKKDKVAPD
jgi:adenylate cyclase